MLTVRISPKISVKPDATTKSRPAKVRPSSSVTANFAGILDGRLGGRVAGQEEHPGGRPARSPARRQDAQAQEQRGAARAHDVPAGRTCRVTDSALHACVVRVTQCFGSPAGMQDQIQVCIQCWMHIDIQESAAPSVPKERLRATRAPSLGVHVRFRKGRLHDAGLEHRGRLGPPIRAGAARARPRRRRRRRARQHRAGRPRRAVRGLVVDVAVPALSRPAAAGGRRGGPARLHRAGAGHRPHRVGVPRAGRAARWRLRNPGRHLRALRRASPSTSRA